MTPAQHLDKCNPVTCPHVRFCQACLERYGVCREHRHDPDSGIFWVEGCEPEPEES